MSANSNKLPELVSTEPEMPLTKAHLPAVIAYFFTQEFATSPTMLLQIKNSDTIIPDTDLEEWKNFYTQMVEADPQLTELQAIQQVMRTKMISLIQNPPQTSGPELANIFALARSVNTDTSLPTIIPEIASKRRQLAGEALALTATGHLSTEAIGVLFTDKDVTEFVNRIAEDNELTAAETWLIILANNYAPEEAARIQADAVECEKIIAATKNDNDKPEKSTPPGVSPFDERPSTSALSVTVENDLSPTGYFLAQLRQYYPTNPDRKQWQTYYSAVRQTLFNERLARKNVKTKSSRTAERSIDNIIAEKPAKVRPNFISKPLKLADGTSTKLAFNKAYQYLAACLLFGRERKLFD